MIINDDLLDRSLAQLAGDPASEAEAAQGSAHFAAALHRLDTDPIERDRITRITLEVDAAGIDAAGTDAAGTDAAGTDAAGIDAAGIDAPAIDAPAIDAPEVALEVRELARVERLARLQTAEIEQLQVEMQLEELRRLRDGRVLAERYMATRAEPSEDLASADARSIREDIEELRSTLRQRRSGVHDLPSILAGVISISAIACLTLIVLFATVSTTSTLVTTGLTLFVALPQVVRSVIEWERARHDRRRSRVRGRS